MLHIHTRVLPRRDTTASRSQSFTLIEPSASADAPSRQLFRSNSERLARVAFTLIELLVVIAIISLLAAMLLPSLQRARGAARTIACSNQIRQIGVASTLYADEHDDTYPAGHFSPVRGFSSPFFWYDKLEDHLGESAETNRIYTCPERTMPQGSNETQYPRTYTAHRFIFINTDETMTFRHMRELLRPSETVVIGDGPKFWSDGGSPYIYNDPANWWNKSVTSDANKNRYLTPTLNADFTNWAPRFRHDSNQTANFVAADGHVMKFRANGLQERNTWIGY